MKDVPPVPVSARDCRIIFWIRASKENGAGWQEERNVRPERKRPSLENATRRDHDEATSRCRGCVDCSLDRSRVDRAVIRKSSKLGDREGGTEGGRGRDDHGGERCPSRRESERDERRNTGHWFSPGALQRPKKRRLKLLLKSHGRYYPSTGRCKVQRATFGRFRDGVEEGSYNLQTKFAKTNLADAAGGVLSHLNECTASVPPS